MSTGFRLFLLTLLTFVVVWLSRYRESDLLYWIRAPMEIELKLQEPDEVSVGEVIEPVIPLTLTAPDVKIRIKAPPGRPLWGNGVIAAEVSLEDAIAETGEGPPGEWLDDDERTLRVLDPGNTDGEGGELADAAFRDGDFQDADTQGELQDDALPGDENLDDGSTDGGLVDQETVDDGSDSNAADVVQGPADPPPQPQEPETREYEIQSLDTLSEISLKLLGTSKRYREILKLNPKTITDPDTLVVGTKILVPAR